MHASFKALALLAAAASSASATVFKLKTHVTDFDLTPSIEGQEVSVESDTGYAYLVQSGSGAVFRSNTTVDTDVTGQTTFIHITPGGTATVPSANVVTFSADAGTQGVGLVGGELEYEEGVFTACPASVLDKEGDDILISFKAAGQRTLFGCANVELQEA
ncbi:hypothetical protein PENSPDRAFT_690413 [Peniophora sp. CONT]|nr:hypothetical protein PENSPDRAFT_690413 [Peniophora sp. CONT]